ncbi:MAG TPA: 5'-nucleotidase C-terminal domain-containing protein [Saprospiraceae bacterium]|nr:5'-nucleotidase C-terminal domain-containing protein [Saprospiraceae bacterium]
MGIKKYTGFLFFLLLITSCKSIQHISHTDITYQIIKPDSTLAPDEATTKLIAPYKVQLDTVMNEVIGNVVNDMYKQRPESSLGNWVADVMFESVQRKGYTADFAIVNYGGLRVPTITAGPLTRGEIFELSPFDNMIMIVDIPGKILDTIFQQIATTGGWPVSKGLKLTMSNKIITGSLIHDQPIVPDKIYKVATLDYVANGGDDMKSLIPLPRVQTGEILRDLLIEDAIRLRDAGKGITAFIEGRIINH